jgi:hypothetical protein
VNIPIEVLNSRAGWRGPWTFDIQHLSAERIEKSYERIANTGKGPTKAKRQTNRLFVPFPFSAFFGVFLRKKEPELTQI